MNIGSEWVNLNIIDNYGKCAKIQRLIFQILNPVSSNSEPRCPEGLRPAPPRLLRAGLSLFPVLLCLPLVALVALVPARSADLYWDANGNSAGMGGSANWTAGNRWRLGSPAGGLQAWSGGADAYFGGDAGTVTLNQDVSLGTAFFLVTGYTITGNNANVRTLGGAIVLSENVALGLLAPDATATRVLRVGGSITGGSGSVLLIQGNQSAGNVARIDLAAANAAVAVPVQIASTGAGLAGFVGEAEGTRIEGSVVNNGSARTMFGASGGNSLTLAGSASVSGTADVQFSAGQAGAGTGLVVVDGTLSHSGDTIFDHALTGVVRVGSSERLSAASRLVFENGTLDLNGTTQIAAGLTGSGGRGIVNTSAFIAEIIADLESGTQTYGGRIGLPADLTNLAGANNHIAFTKLGAGTQVLSGESSYWGMTHVGEGVLALVSDSHRNLIGDSSEITIGSGATLDVSAITAAGGFLLRSGQTLSGNGSVVGRVSMESGSTLAAGGIGGIGSLAFSSDLQASAGSVWLVDLVQSVNGQSDLVTAAGSLDLGGASLQLSLPGTFTQGHVYTIASYGSLSGTFNGISDGAIVHGYRIDYGSGTNGSVTLTAVPEPGALALLGFGIAGHLLAGARRRVREARRKR